VETYHLYCLVRTSCDAEELSEKVTTFAAIDELEATLMARNFAFVLAETLIAIELRAVDGREVQLFHYGEVKQLALREARWTPIAACLARHSEYE
jgi:hypothetical protein